MLNKQKCEAKFKCRLVAASNHNLFLLSLAFPHQFNSIHYYHHFKPLITSGKMKKRKKKKIRSYYT